LYSDEPEPALMKTPCEKVESNRAMFDEEGVGLSDVEWQDMLVLYHQEATDRGDPCPCGLTVPQRTLD
jgi:hypothetical protein